MTKLSRIIYLFVTFIFFVISDIILSNLIISYSDVFPSNEILDLVNIQNNGAAFSILEGSRAFLILFSIFAFIGILFYIIRHIKNISGIGLFCSSLLCAGIFTNMLERLMLGYVRDYIKLNFIDFPVFNISDIFINVSVFVIIVIIVKNKYFKNTNETDN